MGRGIAGLLVLGIACLQACASSPAALRSPLASPSASPPSISASPSPSAPYSAGPSPISIAACEMPFVAASQRVYETGDGSAGFLRLPVGSFRADPNGSMNQATSGQYFIGTSPSLPGAFFTPQRSWDAAANRWLPVPAQQVAADGANYVYQVGPDLHLVTVATGSDKVFYHQPSGMPEANWAGPETLAYSDGSVYLSIASAYKGAGGSLQQIPADQAGLWRIDPAGGAPTRVLTVPIYGLVTVDGTRLLAIEDDTSNPPTGRLMVYDLKTALATQWFIVPGSGMDLLGVETKGNPIVWTYDYNGGLKIWIVSAPNMASEIDSEAYVGNVPFYAGNGLEFGPLVSDSHGVWFGSVNGLFLYDQSGMRKVADDTGIPVGRCT